MLLDQIIAAVKQRQRMWLHYEPGKRLIEPHALGHSKDGHILVRAFQVEGVSASGEHVNWKLLRLDRIKDLLFSGQIFTDTRPLYNPRDSAMKGGIIICL